MTRTRSRCRPASRLFLEPLENRTLPSINLSGVPTWVEQGPGSINDGAEAGAIEAIAAIPAIPVVTIADAVVNATNAANLYVGTVNGGIWHTTNGTNPHPSWTPQTDFSMALSIGAIAFSPLDSTHQTLYAGAAATTSYPAVTGPNVGMLKTTDGGHTWVPLGQLVGRKIRNIISVDSRTAPGGIRGEEVVLVATDGGVFRSVNGGGFDPAPDPVPSGGRADIASDPGNPMIVYAAVVGRGVYVSTNAGGDWSALPAPMTSATAFTATSNLLLAVHSDAANNVLYAAAEASDGSQTTVYYMIDPNSSGASWNAMTPLANFGGNGTYLSFAADAINPSLVYIGGYGDNVVMRGDRNLTVTPQWSNINSGIHADSRRMTFDAENNLLESDDGGIYRLNNPATSSSFESVNGNIRATELLSVAYDSQNQIVFGGAQDNGTAEQTASDDWAWEEVSGRDGGVVAIDNSDPDLALRYVHASVCAVDDMHRLTFDSSNNLLDRDALGMPSPDGVRLALTGLPPEFYDDAGNLVERCGTYGLNALPNHKSQMLINIYPKAGGTISNTTSTDVSPIVVTSPTKHGLTTGERVTISGVTGNLAANGTFTITKVSDTQFSLNGTSGTGNYGGGGSWVRIGGLFEGTVEGDTVTLTNISGPITFGPNRNFNTSTVNGVNFVYGGRSPHGGDNPGFIYIGVNASSSSSAFPRALYVRKSADEPFLLLTTYNVGSDSINPRGDVIHVAVDPYDWHTLYVTDGAKVYRGVFGTDFLITDDGPTEVDATNWTNITGNLRPFTSIIRTIEVANPTGIPGHEIVLVGGEGGVFRYFDPGDGSAPHWSRYGTGLPHNNTLDLHYYGDIERVGDLPDLHPDLLLAGTFGRGAWTVANASATLATPGILHINGDTDFLGENDVIRLVRDASAPALLDVYLNSSMSSMPSLQVELNALQEIDVNGFGGNDTLIVDSSNGLIDVREGIHYDGGAGFNRLLLQQPGGAPQDTDVYTLGPGADVGNNTIIGATGTQRVYFQNLTAVADFVPARTLSVHSTPADNVISYTAGALVTNGLVTVDDFAALTFSNKDNLVINGEAGADTFNINNPNTPAGLTRITVNGGVGDDTIVVGAVADDLLVIVNGGPGSDTLVGPDQDNVWHITHGNRGTLDSSVSFSLIENLTGGPLADRFQFDPLGAISGMVNGNGGSNTLDYSAFTSDVVVNLLLGSAPGVTPGGFLDTDNATGGGGNDIILGADGNNLLDGGPGRDVVIGELGKDELLGGTEDDLLIAGSVIFEKDDAALEAVRAEWSRTDESYLQRVGHLCHGGGLNGAIRLDSMTVTADAAANTLTGDDGRDWFWADLVGPPTDGITDQKGGELLGCPTFFVVTNTKNGGPGSLRQAILDANANPGNDVILFDIFAAGVQTIRPESALPDVTDPVIIDGYTQPGSTPNTLAVGNDSVHLIELDGSLAGAASGLVITNGLSMVRGLVINRFAQMGVLLEGGGNNVVEGNFLGTDVTGTVALGNSIGVFANTSRGNFVGLPEPGGRNVISGNGDGVDIDGRAGDASGNHVQNNYIGTDARGTAILGNASVGVRIVLADNDQIGGPNPLEGNLIIGGLTGVALSGNGHVVQGNTIARNTYDGIFFSGVGNDAAGILIGGTLIGAGNVIYGSTHGIEIAGSASRDNRIEGNRIGTDATGTVLLGNSVAGVFIWFGANHNTIGGSPSGLERRNPFGNLLSGNGTGVVISGAGTDDNVVEGNYIGTEILGTGALGNFGAGVRIEAGARFNRIGDTAFLAGNLISGNAGSGVVISGAGTDENWVGANYIGTNSLGTAALGNFGAGVRIEAGARFNHIGDPAGSRFLTGNLISGNAGNGVEIAGADSIGNIVQGNFIGTDATGTERLANHGSGLLIEGAAGNHIGDLAPPGRNLISGNLLGGVRLTAGAHGNDLRGNYIGTDVTGTQPLGNIHGGVSLADAPDNDVFHNLISANLGDGVHLAGAATTRTQIEENLIGPDFVDSTRAVLGNTGHGVSIDGAPANAVYHNTIAHNHGWGVLISGSGAGANSLDRNSIFQNIGGVEIIGAPGNAVGFSGRSGWGNDVVSNIADGVRITGDGASANTVVRNKIGGNGGDGVAIVGAPGNFIGGSALGSSNNIFGNHLSGIRVEGAAATGNLIEGNFIGTTPDGAFAQGNDQWGITILAASHTQVGGPALGQRNLISGNGRTGYDGGGIHIGGTGASGNVIQGNLIGTDAAGSAALPNHGNGIEIVGANAINNQIGGTEIGAGNVISANELNGVLIDGAALTVVLGNRIGTGADGTTALGNHFDGIEIGATNSQIGGTLSGASNTIAFNGSAGVRVVAGAGNAILSNSIHDNAALGIDLGIAGVTLNDGPGDPDTGPNGLQNFPVLDAAHSIPGGSTTVTGFLTSEPATTYLIQFFVSNPADPSGYGEGRTFLGSVTKTTNLGGGVPIMATLPYVFPGGFITATATRMVSTAKGLVARDTSEFSARRKVTGPFVMPPPDAGVRPAAASNPMRATARPTPDLGRGSPLAINLDALRADILLATLPTVTSLDTIGPAPRGAIQWVGLVLKKIDTTDPPSYPEEFFTDRNQLSRDIEAVLRVMADPAGPGPFCAKAPAANNSGR